MFLDKGSEIDPETEYLQAVGAPCLWRRTFCIMSQRVNIFSKIKSSDVVEAKASFKRALS